MQVRKRIKSVAAALALLFSYATVAAVPATGATAAEQTLELQNTCSVEEYEVTNWWKAELSDYDASLTPVSLTDRRMNSPCEKVRYLPIFCWRTN